MVRHGCDTVPLNLSQIQLRHCDMKNENREMSRFRPSLVK